MTPLALALPEGATVSRAAALMAYEGVHRIPIVSDDGVVVGILAAVDVLRWLATSSGYALGAQSTADKPCTSD
jgi:CBS domain-containing protein